MPRNGWILPLRGDVAQSQPDQFSGGFIVGQVFWVIRGAGQKPQIAQQVAAAATRQYVDVRALLLDPVDLRGIPWRDSTDRTRWAPPAFLPPSDDRGRWLINLEELPSAVPMVQAGM